MLKIVNEELFAYEPIKIHDRVNDREYSKIKVLSSNKIVQNEETMRQRADARNHNNQSQGTPQKIECGIDNLIPVNKEILRISAPLSRIEDTDPNFTVSKIDYDAPMSINVNQANKFQPLVEVRCHENGDDRANLYVVAFPFNGMIKPIPDNPQYRIYKGVLVSSAKPFFFKNHKYRKILYLVIEVNKNLFKEDHKYHTDSIAIEFESFALREDRETGKKTTAHETYKINVVSSNGDYTESWDYETINDSIIINNKPGENLWVTYIFENSNNNQNGQNPRNNRPNNSNHSNNKPQSVEGNMLVSTNKHGIRKETPLPKKRYNPGGNGYYNKNNNPDYNRNNNNQRRSNNFDR